MSTELSKVNTNSQPSSAPAWMTEAEPQGIDNIKQFVKPPRLKIIQPQARAPFSELFNKGDLVIVPQNEVIAPVILNEAHKSTDKGKSINLVPLFFFPEWLCWNPIQLQGKIPVIRDRTFDESSELARKAKLMLQEPCPDGAEYNIRYVEHLNFVVLFSRDAEVSPLVDMNIAVVSFARGTYKSGQTWLSLITMRRKSIFAGQYEAHTQFKSNDKGEWYTLDVANPTKIPAWVEDRAVYAKLEELHREYKTLHEKAMLVVEHDDNADQADDSEFAAPKSGDF